MWDGRTRPPSACARSGMCSMLTPPWGSDSHNKHAAPDRQISAFVRASRNFCSADVSGHHCATARLLSSPGRPPVPRYGSWSARCPQHWVLQPRLLPRRDHIPVGTSAAGAEVGLRALSRRSPRRIAFENSGHEALRIAIPPRPSASLHRLTDHASRPIRARVGPGL